MKSNLFSNKDIAEIKNNPNWHYNYNIGTLGYVYKKIESLNNLKIKPDCYLCADFAFPHTDVDISRKFLTLPIYQSGRYIFGDKNRDFKIEMDKFFVVDPKITHWLYTEEWETHKKFIALQWEIDRSKFKKTVEKIVCHFGINYHEIL